MNDIEDFGKGGLREDIPDPRDYQWGRDVGMSAIPFDWQMGYDVEHEISQVLGQSFQLPVKNQNGSSSCGGQAWAYYGQVLDTLTDKVTEEKSAKFIYAQTHIGVGGSGGNDNCNVCINKGWGNEADTPSYEAHLPPSEAFMIQDGDISPVAYQNALKDRGLAYANVFDRNVENIATAVRDNHGCILGLTGSNNGTWRTAFPQPPINFPNSWNHWLYVGKVKMIDGKKYFGVLNSWGSDVGEQGWQWLSEEYITIFILGYPVIWSIWTMVAKSDVIVPVYVFTKTLRIGDRNSDVKMLQIKLGLIADGYFGKMTKAGVVLFQKAHGLVADGIVGPNTNKELNKL